ncbi:BLUF domain-containing protein [Marinobacterium jannaschii]|uniref:BLUF domain-containing protein n=1 Tax=Marinobacterium jannaschii TaxID=64970 RepID=UPI0004839091|nr:BLUF domain-containing protein [Marinobacterium jannaschii]
MTQVRLLYFSRATRDMSLSDLKDILGKARANNDSLEVCGMLCYENRYFLQALEGERSALNELYLDIAEDPRHDEITLISYCEVDSPTFERWKMGYAAGSAEFYRLLKEMGQTEFSPAVMNEAQALSFLKLMSGNQSGI